MNDELRKVVSGIGPKIKALRAENGLSLQALGARADVSAATIHKMEQGDMVPTITTLLKIAGAVGRTAAARGLLRRGAGAHSPHRGDQAGRAA
jgi:transcriptional regulator with XRE-family HTH domain